MTPGNAPGSNPTAAAGPPGSSPAPTGGTGQGGQGAAAGQGSGGNPLGEERPALETASRIERDIQDPRGGRVLSSWRRDGEPGEGTANLTFNQAVQEARAEGERAVSEQRVPKRYHRAIKEYLGNLPESPSDPPPPSPPPPSSPSSGSAPPDAAPAPTAESGAAADADTP